MPRSPHPGPTTASYLALALALGGCGAEARSLTDPAALASEACAAAPDQIGIPLLLVPGTSCVVLGPGPATYAVAFFDPRFVEAARGAPEAVVPEQRPYSVTVRAGTGVGPPPPRNRVVAAPAPPPATEPGPPVADGVVRLSRSGPADACPSGAGYEVFCHGGRWEVGDTLTVPAPFGRFAGETARPVEIFALRGPLAFAVARNLREDERARLEPILQSLGKIGILRILPLLRRAVVDRPVYTSTGSQQLLVDVVFDRIPVCVCGVAVGRVVDGVGVAGVSLRFPEGVAFEADRVGLFAHELAHVWQLAHEASRAGTPGASPPTTSWALEGGADLVRQEVLRDLSFQPLAGNRDASRPATNAYLDRMLRNLRAADGRIRDGYGQSAGLLRHLFLEATRAGALYETALRTVLLGALEGWYPSADPTYAGDGLTGRLRDYVPGFEPVSAVLGYALANAADDRTANGDLQNHTVLDSWRESEGSSFVPAATIGPNSEVSLSRPPGSVGYLYVRHDGGPARLGLESEPTEVRWMVVRFE